MILMMLVIPKVLARLEILEIPNFLEILEIPATLAMVGQDLRGPGKNAPHGDPEHALGPARKGMHSIWPWMTHGWAEK